MGLSVGYGARDDRLIPHLHAQHGAHLPFYRVNITLFSRRRIVTLGVGGSNGMLVPESMVISSSHDVSPCLHSSACVVWVGEVSGGLMNYVLMPGVVW